MNNSVLVFDNVLNDISPELNSLLTETLVPLDWYPLNYQHEYKDFCIQMLNIASNYFDLSKTVGYEFWGHNGSKPNWHYDKDEKLFDKEKKLVFPICSTVYYLEVSNLEGGKLLIEDDYIISPKTNRLVIFPPGKYHTVENYQGKRVSLLVNPWDHEINH